MSDIVVPSTVSQNGYHLMCEEERGRFIKNPNDLSFLFVFQLVPWNNIFFLASLQHHLLLNWNATRVVSDII